MSRWCVVIGRWWRWSALVDSAADQDDRSWVQLVAICERCGGEVSEWVVVRWQRERDSRGESQVLAAGVLGSLCPECAVVVRDAIQDAVTKAIGGAP